MGRYICSSCVSKWMQWVVNAVWRTPEPCLLIDLFSNGWQWLIISYWSLAFRGVCTKPKNSWGGWQSHIKIMQVYSVWYFFVSCFGPFLFTCILSCPHCSCLHLKLIIALKVESFSHFHSVLCLCQKFRTNQWYLKERAGHQAEPKSCWWVLTVQFFAKLVLSKPVDFSGLGLECTLKLFLR